MPIYCQFCDRNTISVEGRFNGLWTQYDFNIMGYIGCNDCRRQFEDDKIAATQLVERQWLCKMKKRNSD